MRPRSRHRSAARGAQQPPAVASEGVATVRIDRLAAGGDGVARIEGLACFVPRTAPGDLVQVAFAAHARYARGRVLQRLESGPDRIEPICKHYDGDRCGGCQLQHLNATSQGEARRAIVRDALLRVAKREIDLPELVTGREWAYRERLTLALRPKGTSWIGGLHAHGEDARVFSLDECAIAHPRLLEAWTYVRRSLHGLPRVPAEQTLRVSLRLTATPTDGAAPLVAVVLLGGTRWPEARAWADALQNGFPIVGSVWWEAASGDVTHLAGDPDPTALSFAQVNPTMAAALGDDVVAAIMAMAPRQVVDAYSGRGDLSLRLAEAGIPVTAIEADARATAVASARLSSFPHSRVLTGLVEDVLAETLPADVVVLNPPRRGLDPRVTAILAEARHVQAIVYVSCDPATLARDLSRMPRWHVASIRCFDMFPQTAHVETLCVLTPDGS